MTTVGLYFDLRNTSGSRRDSVRLHSFVLEMCAEAESLGAGSVWFSEHHQFVDEYLSQPLTFAAAVAARTRRIRIGTAVLVAPLHHPVEIAEQAALVDVLSDGRLDLGLGAGYRKAEFALFGARHERRYATTDATWTRLGELWSQITPRPVQDPPPVWLGYQGPRGARRAGRLGAPLLSASAELWPRYREGLVEGGHTPAAGRMAGVFHGWVSEDPERDRPLVRGHLAYQLDSYREHAGGSRGRSHFPDVDAVLDGTAERRFMLGTPEEVAAAIRAHTAGAPVETVFLWASVGGMDEAHTAAHVRTICGRLAPLLSAPPR